MALPPSDSTQPLVPSHPPDFHHKVYVHVSPLPMALNELEANREDKSEIGAQRILNDLEIDAKNLCNLMEEYPPGFEPNLKKAMNHQIKVLQQLVKHGAAPLIHDQDGKQLIAQAKRATEDVLGLIKQP